MKVLLQRHGYVFDSSLHIWSKPQYGSIAYSDGDDIEQRLAHIIENASDLTVLSAELRRHCTDWPSLYHLSSSRANILRPFEQALTGDILEVGCGCGAITRYLGETGGNVLALEGSVRRASIARSRTRDLKNVTVIAEKFDQFKCEKLFDVITLVGVLEYANLFTPGDDPALTMLRRAISFLKPEGKLIIAIENQLGLKYFSGAPEDHLGSPMYSVEDRYTDAQPRTYGRKTLAGMLKKAGFQACEFLAPFPDYKLPASIVTEHGMKCKEFDASAFAWQSVRRDPQLPQYSGFSLELAWPQIFKNDLALDTANSFLVVASRQDAVLINERVLAYHYSTDRFPQYCKETLFELEQEDGITVKYRKLAPACADTPTDQNTVELNVPTSVKYSLGHPLSFEFIKIVTRDSWTFAEVGNFLHRYVDIIATISSESQSNKELDPKTVLPGECFDLTPQNIIIDENGNATTIDTEWKLREPIELGHLLFRSLVWMSGAITRFGKPEPQLPLLKYDFLQQSLRQINFDLDTPDFSRYIAIEASAQKQITGAVFEDFLHGLFKQPLQTQNLIELADSQANEILERHHTQMANNDKIAELNKTVEQCNAKNIVLELEIEKREARLSSIAHTLAERDREIASIKGSRSWTITRPLRDCGVILRRAFRPRSLKIIRSQGGVKASLIKVVQVYQREGMSGIKLAFKRLRYSEDAFLDRNNYRTWVERYDTLTNDLRNSLIVKQNSFSKTPRISVIMPTYNSTSEWLIAAIESVRGQIYPYWELCIADDASTDPTVRPILEQYALQDSRIKVSFREQNGHISASSNSALELATGEWVALLDHDDLLTEHALHWVADAICNNDQVRLIYSDEDKIDEKGERFQPYFKSDWNQDLVYSHNLVTHLGVYNTQLVRQIGGFRIGFEGAQDHDLVLRYVEHISPAQIHHIPKILYHWRTHPMSTALSSGAKPYATVAGEKALNEHFRRTKINATAVSVPHGYRAQHHLPLVLPLVTLVIPTRNGVDLLKQCVDSILDKTDYQNFEIIIIDNGSDESSTLDYLASLCTIDKVRVIRDERPFNYSALNNSAVRHANGEIIGLLNNDIEVISPEWLSEMVSHALRPDIGAVGARLWYPDDTLQHGGVITGLGGVAGHAHKHLPNYSSGYINRAALIQNFSAVTAACLVIKKSIYEKVGGLNETDLSVAFNDVDFCLKVREAGYRNIWTPYAELYHHESATRGFEDTPEKQMRFGQEIAYMKKRWGAQLINDPAYSPNLTLDYEDFSLAWPPRVASLQTHNNAIDS